LSRGPPALDFARKNSWGAVALDPAGPCAYRGGILVGTKDWFSGRTKDCSRKSRSLSAGPSFVPRRQFPGTAARRRRQRSRQRLAKPLTAASTAVSRSCRRAR